MHQTLRFLDPAQLATIADLQLLARTVVEGLMTGLHRSPQSGASIEFDQYRPYTQGEPLRFVDWKLYGRTDRLHVKQFEDETNLRCTILLDCSASMGYGSVVPDKFEYARMLTACLAMILHRQRDQAGFVAYHNELLTYLPPRGTRAHRQRLFTELAQLESAGQTDTAAALHYLGDVLAPRGMVVLISDLLQPLDEVRTQLRTLRARRHDVVVFQITDPAERTFPFDATATFVDAESGAEQYAVPDSVREAYLENRSRHFDVIQAECAAHEIQYLEVGTDEPLDRALQLFLNHRRHALMTSSRSRQPAPGGAL